MTMRKYISWLKTMQYSSSKNNNTTIEHEFNGSSYKLIKLLKGIWSPFCVKGQMRLTANGANSKVAFHKSSSLFKLNVTELLAEAKQSPFGHGTSTVTDTAVRNSFEIDAKDMNSDILQSITDDFIDISKLCPSQQLEVRPYKLVIYQEGGHFDAHRDTVRGEGHIGTLVVILNSEYTGGELEVTHGGRSETVTGAYSWVAMYGDCVHQIHPVTSGTRVSLIYDIYSIGAVSFEKCSASRNGKEDVHAHAFWSSRLQQEPIDHSSQISVATKEAVSKEVERELKGVDTLILTLQHLYPECQTSSAFLKGGDRALYELLSEQYEVQVVAATIYRSYFYGDGNENTIYGDLFTPAKVASALVSLKDGDAYSYVPPEKRQKTDAAPKTKIIIPNHFHEDSVLDYSPYIEYTGNESQAEETVYIVAGLQVRKKE